MRLFDTHSHYNDVRFDEDRDEVIAMIHSENVAKTVVVGDNVESSRFATEIANKYDFIYSAVRYSSKRDC